MNIICKLTISSIKNYLFIDKYKTDSIYHMPPFVFYFEHQQDDEKNITYKLFKPSEVLVEINEWDCFTQTFDSYDTNEGCAIISIVEDIDTLNEYIVFCIYENTSGGINNSFRFPINEMFQEEITNYEWFNINEFCENFGLRSH